jgi:hypothetical protein
MAREILERLQPDQSTNLGAGLLAGIKTAASTGSQFSSVFLLTDGVPTDQDLDFKGAMRRQFKKFPLFGSLHTFGFGYSLNSQLLRLISKEGDGVFAFIPDAGMVGTIFINAIANIRTVYAVKSRLVLPAIVDSSLIVGDYRVETDPDAQTTTIHLPSLRYGQSTDILVRFPVGHALSKALKVDNCKLIACNLIEEFSIQPSLFPDFTKEQELFQMARANASVNMFKASVDDKNSHAALAEICARLESKRANNETLDALCRDLSGQVTMAYSRDDWFQRWGKHYLLSVAFAYMHQICNNFKDPGVQLYGRGRLFIKMQGQLNDLFLSLPPPPRRQTYSNYSSYQSQTSGAGAAPIDMTLYNNAGGVCFHPSCLVRMATGESKAIARLQKGDLIQTKNSVAEVRCVVFNQLPHGYCKMVCVGGERLWLTEYHPVRVDGGQWTFAKDLADAKGELIPTDFVCNLVLDDGHCVTIDGVQCCTLGHAFTDNEVIRHDYFGTQAVINDLSQLNGWNTGRVVIQSQQIVRDEKSKKVSQIRHYLTAGSAV